MISFGKATNRKTECYSLYVAGVQMLISYETIVAASYGGKRIRQKNHWGPTTGKHMHETGVSGYEVVESESEFSNQVDSMIYQAIADSVDHRMAA